MYHKPSITPFHFFFLSMGNNNADGVPHGVNAPTSQGNEVGQSTRQVEYNQHRETGSSTRQEAAASYGEVENNRRHEHQSISRPADFTATKTGKMFFDKK